jgi:predicted nucleotidyltransferase
LRELLPFSNATKLGTIVRNMVAPTNPGSILFGSTRQAILALTFLRPDESFYLREIVRRTGCGTGSVQRELKLLTGSGILRRDRHRFYQANPNSPIYEPLKQIVIRTIGIGDRLRGALHPVADQIAVALIFGSFSRGEQNERSDVDVLVITTDDQLTSDQVNTLLRHDQEQLGREINPFVLTTAEWQLKWSTGNPFVRRILDGEKVYLIGDDDELGRLAEKRVAQAAPAEPAGNRRSAGVGRARSQKRAGQRTRR